LARTADGTSYRELLATPGFGRLAGSSLLARVGGQMWGVAIVLYVLERFHSPSLAGLTVFISLAPGLLISPLAGAALDRWGRIRLICVDYVLGAATLVGVVVMAAAGVLTVPSLLVLMAVSSLTVPLGFAGARSLFPILAPSHLWDRANALDSAIYSASNVAGPALAGVLYVAIGGGGTLLVVAAVWVAAVFAVLGIREPARRETDRNVLGGAGDGLRETFRNPVLRAMSLSIPIANASRGVLILALPVFILHDLHRGPDVVGFAWSVGGLAALVSGILAGRLATLGKERRLIGACMIGQAAVLAGLAAAPSQLTVYAALFLTGLLNGPQDVALFSLRQRSVSTALLGRVLAISMSLNFLGQPIGSAIGGPLVAGSARLGMAASAAFLAVGAVLLWVLLPRPALAQSSTTTVAPS